jgi:ribosomal protein L11 methyltransferase
MPKHFVEVEIIADAGLSEQIVGVLSQLGFEGFWEEEPFLRGYISGERWDDAMLDEVRSLVNTIHRSSSSVVPKVSVKDVAQRNWNEEWERTIQPIHVTDRIVITPTWHRYTPRQHELVLTIDPKMSFGTGYHETTRLVLRMMEQHLRPGSTVLDVGTGTGVLAIAAIKLGAARAVGVDTDEWSYTNARENTILNGVEKDVTIYLGDLASVPVAGFDVIVANIQRSVLEPLLPALIERMNTGGMIILSGLLNGDEQPMRKAISNCGLQVTASLAENEWIALLLQSTNP